jgi:hypothetical protein
MSLWNMHLQGHDNGSDTFSPFEARSPARGVKRVAEPQVRRTDSLDDTIQGIIGI